MYLLGVINIHTLLASFISFFKVGNIKNREKRRTVTRICHT